MPQHDNEQAIKSQGSQNHSDDVLGRLPAPFRLLIDFARELEKKKTAGVVPSPAANTRLHKNEESGLNSQDLIRSSKI